MTVVSNYIQLELFLIISMYIATVLISYVANLIKTMELNILTEENVLNLTSI